MRARAVRREVPGVRRLCVLSFYPLDASLFGTTKDSFNLGPQFAIPPRPFLTILIVCRRYCARNVVFLAGDLTSSGVFPKKKTKQKRKITLFPNTALRLGSVFYFCFFPALLFYLLQRIRCLEVKVSRRHARFLYIFGMLLKLTGCRTFMFCSAALASVPS